jgi:hypothetical protein
MFNCMYYRLDTQNKTYAHIYTYTLSSHIIIFSLSEIKKYKKLKKSTRNFLVV